MSSLVVEMDLLLSRSLRLSNSCPSSPLPARIRITASRPGLFFPDFQERDLWTIQDRDSGILIRDFRMGHVCGNQLGTLYSSGVGTNKTKQHTLGTEAWRRRDCQLPPRRGWGAEPRLRPQDHHDHYGKSAQPHQNGQLTHPHDLDAPLRIAAKSKIDDYREQYANNQNIRFLTAITSTSTRMHGEFLRLLFLQAHRETTAHFTSLEMPAQQHCDSFHYSRARSTMA